LNLFKAKWDSIKPIWTILIDHVEIDNIERSYTKTKAFVLNKDFSSASSECSELLLLVNHIPEKEQLSIKNVF
jgi:hypothetical protein